MDKNEMLEHVADVDKILSEAFRVARKNVLIPVPNCENINQMRANDVTYAHMLSSDHVHFFDPGSLENLLRRYSKDVSIERSDPIYSVLKPRFLSRLYAVAGVREN